MTSRRTGGRWIACWGAPLDAGGLGQSSLNFLIRLGCVDVLPTLFGHVLIPPKVEEELTRGTTPPEVRRFIAARPAWLEVRAPAHVERIAKLDAGEEAAICLAQEVHADLVLLDDADARKAAVLRGLQVVGLLGVLERADERGLLNLEETAARFPADYRIDAGLVEAALERRLQRRSGGPT